MAETVHTESSVKDEDDEKKIAAGAAAGLQEEGLDVQQITETHFKNTTVTETARAESSVKEEDQREEAVKEEDDAGVATDQHEGVAREEDDEKTVDAGSAAGPQEEGFEVQQQLTETNDHDETPKRYLPDNKKPDAAPTFPEKVRLLHSNVLRVLVVRIFFTVL